MTTHEQASRMPFERYLRLEISLNDLRTATARAWDLKQTQSGYVLTPMPAVEPPVEFDGTHVLRVLAAFVDVKFRQQEVQDWANLLILSDVFSVSVVISPAARDKVLGFLHEIASPEINGPLSRTRAQEMILELS